MKNPSLLLVAALMAVLGTVQGLRADSQPDDTAQINALYQKFATAFRDKDAAGVMALYVRGNNLFVFDVGTPREHAGWQSYYNDWKGFFASIKGRPAFHISELNVTVSGDVAYTRSIQSVAANMGNIQALNVRVTDVLRKIDGKWLIVQEHVSVPIDVQTLKPDLMSRP